MSDYDAPKLYEEKIVKARKEHKCSECCEVIMIGDRYMLHVGLWDDHWSKYKTCPGCMEIIADARKEDSDFAYAFSQLFTCLSEADLGHLITMAPVDETTEPSL